MGGEDKKKDGAEEKKEEKTDEGGENGAKDEDKVIEDFPRWNFGDHRPPPKKKKLTKLFNTEL